MEESLHDILLWPDMVPVCFLVAFCFVWSTCGLLHNLVWSQVRWRTPLKRKSVCFPLAASCSCKIVDFVSKSAQGATQDVCRGSCQSGKLVLSAAWNLNTSSLPVLSEEPPAEMTSSNHSAELLTHQWRPERPSLPQFSSVLSQNPWRLLLFSPKEASASLPVWKGPHCLYEQPMVSQLTHIYLFDKFWLFWKKWSFYYVDLEPKM